MVFFAHLLVLEYPDHHQNLISSLLYYPGPLHKILAQPVHDFLSNVVHRQTDKHTNRQTNATKNITSFAKEVMMNGLIHDNSASWTSCYFLFLHIFRSHTRPICFWNGHKSFPVNCVGIYLYEMIWRSWVRTWGAQYFCLSHSWTTI